MMSDRMIDRQTSVVRDLERNATEVTNYYVFQAEPNPSSGSYFLTIMFAISLTFTVLRMIFG